MRLVSAATAGPAQGIPTPFPELLDRLLDRRSLSPAEAESVMAQVLEGGLGPERLAAFVTAVRAKPLDAGELAGFARALRQRSHHVRSPGALGPLLDTCGTGASRLKTFNVSTASAFVVAAAGVRVAKHGNRSVTRPSGSADVLEAAGATIGLSPEQAERILAEVGIVFLHAPAFHPAMKHAAPVRQALGIRTVFNLLGPLCNPAGATHQVVGVYDPAALQPMAEALRLLGVRDAYVLHGHPGFDEASVSGETQSVLVRDGQPGRPAVHTPKDLGLPRHDPSWMAPVPREEAAGVLRGILCGQAGPRSDMVAANAGYALHLAGRAPSLREAVALAQDVLRSGKGAKLLDAYVAATNSTATPDVPASTNATKLPRRAGPV
ncbi:MAG TPA: anthranilate phosphoribosyltransferase [Candidatus Thermoplasmatota archaeon]|nr:anthranilate phosphoribosyltransferase [Candidatus Thermoplasmatota archaeon]